jgi:hypothetical protein
MTQILVSSETPAQEQVPAKKLLQANWRSQDKVHFICTLDEATGKFRNVAVKSLEEADSFASAFSAVGLDTYFAIAEYATADNRKTENAVGAWAFIADIDVGPRKAAVDRGYASVEEALTALKEFCVKVELPEPNVVVNSGTGVHAYWVFDEFLSRVQWLVYAGKFKALMKSNGLHADPSRTADIASVLRVPGTFNQKYSPPRPVCIISSNSETHELSVLLDGIDAAMVTLGIAAETGESSTATEVAGFTPAPLQDDFERDPPNMLTLASALKTLTPDCSEKDWKFYRIAPLAYETRYFPELHDALYNLARSWSSGELGGVLRISRHRDR